MQSPTGVTTGRQQSQKHSGVGSRGTITTEADETLNVAYSDEHPFRGTWLSESPSTGMLTGVPREMAFYYGACWLQHRSAQCRGKRASEEDVLLKGGV